MDKAIKQEAVVFMPDRQSPKTVQPTDRAFDDPASLVAAHASAIIGRFLDPVAPMGTDEDDVLFLHLVPQRIAVVGAIQDHGVSIGNATPSGIVDKTGPSNSVSALFAAAVMTPTGTPVLSTAISIFIPLPTLVLPTSSPLFALV